MSRKSWDDLRAQLTALKKDAADAKRERDLLRSELQLAKKEIKSLRSSSSNSSIASQGEWNTTEMLVPQLDSLAPLVRLSTHRRSAGTAAGNTNLGPNAPSPSHPHPPAPTTLPPRPSTLHQAQQPPEPSQSHLLGHLSGASSRGPSLNTTLFTPGPPPAMFKPATNTPFSPRSLNPSSHSQAAGTGANLIFASSKPPKATASS
jgi:hypothetical protein